jgi:hypothetical protein
MPPLNTPEGQQKLDELLEQRGPFSFAIFDNIQALLVGIMKDEEQWAAILPWVKSLTKRHIGQLWLHHTGHDESHGYGSKAREWQMDLVGLMKRVEDPETDLAFTIEWTKARERTPDNRDQFEPVTLRLIDDVWVAGAVAASANLSKAQALAYEALCSLVAAHGEKVTAPDMPDVLSVSVKAFQNDLERRGVIEGATPRARFKELRDALKFKKRAGELNGRIWPLQKPRPCS